MSLLLHGLVAAIVLLMPWPLSYTPLWLLLLSFVVFDSVRSQRRINARQGEIKLLMDSRLRWQGKEWDILGVPRMLNAGMMLRLRKVGRTLPAPVAGGGQYGRIRMAGSAPDVAATADAGVTRVS